MWTDSKVSLIWFPNLFLNQSKTRLCRLNEYIVSICECSRWLLMSDSIPLSVIHLQAIKYSQPTASSCTQECACNVLDEPEMLNTYTLDELTLIIWTLLFYALSLGNLHCTLCHIFMCKLSLRFVTMDLKKKLNSLSIQM